MKVNKDELEKLAALDDRSLWNSIVQMAKNYGISLSPAMPQREDMDKIRGALSGIEKFNLRDAMKIVNRYKNR